MMKKRGYWGLISFIFVASVAFGAPTAQADAPQVTSLSISPAQIPNDYSFALVWADSNSYGNEYLFTCPTGVTIKTAAGATVPCGTRQPIGLGQANARAFSATNVTGVARNITATLYPQDASYVDVDAGAQTATASVSPLLQPFTDFSA